MLVGPCSRRSSPTPSSSTQRHGPRYSRLIAKLTDGSERPTHSSSASGSAENPVARVQVTAQLGDACAALRDPHRDRLLLKLDQAAEEVGPLARHLLHALHALTPPRMSCIVVRPYLCLSSGTYHQRAARLLHLRCPGDSDHVL